MEQAGIAHYHLPGLFEFYELYRVFLPLFREHREYFYDWCDIGSIYGAPADCVWGGGRVGGGACDSRDVRALMREYGVSARLTFSNSLLRAEHLSDARCNALCALFSSDGQTRNGVIVHSDVLLDYLQRTYPNLYFVSSTTKVLTEFEDLRHELARDAFSYVVPDFRLNKQVEKLNALPLALKDKAQCEQLVSEIKNNATSCGAQELVTACPLCAYNLTANGAADSLPTRYFTELLAEALGVAESEGGAE